MHHLVFGFNFQIYFVSLINPVSIHLLIHSTHPCHHVHSQHLSLLYSFTPGSKPTSYTDPSHLSFTSCLYLNAFSLNFQCSYTIVSMVLLRHTLLTACSQWL